MLSNYEQELFKVTIDLNRTIRFGNMDTVSELIDRINSLDQTEKLTSNVLSSLDTQPIVTPVEHDPFIPLVNGIECILNKEYLIKQHDLEIALNVNDKGKLQQIIADAIADTEMLSNDENDFFYVGMLIRACSQLKDYESMDIIRERLG